MYLELILKIVNHISFDGIKIHADCLVSYNETIFALVIMCYV